MTGTLIRLTYRHCCTAQKIVIDENQFYIVDDIDITNIGCINLLVMRFSQDITGSGDDGDTPALDYCLVYTGLQTGH